MKKQMLFGDFRALAAKELGVAAERQRWWKWAKRQNGTLRPTSPLADADDALTVLDVCRARTRAAATSALAPHIGAWSWAELLCADVQAPVLQITVCNLVIAATASADVVACCSRIEGSH